MTRAGNLGPTKRKAPFKKINFSLYFSHKAYTERFHSPGQHLRKFIGTKETLKQKNGSIPRGPGLKHQHGRCFVVFEHHYDKRDAK